MRIILLTQDEPFYLAENIKYLINSLPNDMKIVGAVISSPSPYAKKENFISKSFKTLSIFGLRFFSYYLFLYLFNYFQPSKKVQNILEDSNIQILKLKNSINTEDSLQQINQLSPDLFISILGTDIFKEKLLKLAKYGCINLHTSLLPKYRGLMPTFWALKNNEEFIGISVFLVDKGIDSGPIIEQTKIPINEKSQREIIVETKRIGMDLIIKALHKIKNNNIKYIENLDSKKTYYSFPTRQDVIELRKKGKRLL